MSVKPQLDDLLARMNWMVEKAVFSDITFHKLLLEMLTILTQEVSNLSDSVANVGDDFTVYHIRRGERP